MPLFLIYHLLYVRNVPDRACQNSPTRPGGTGISYLDSKPRLQLDFQPEIMLSAHAEMIPIAIGPGDDLMELNRLALTGVNHTLHLQ